MCQDIKDCILRGDIGRWASHLHLASAYANTDAVGMVST